MTAGSGCPLPLAPVCDVVGGAGASVAGDILSALVGWVVTGAAWLLDQLGNVLSSTTTVNLNATWFLARYEVIVAIAGVVAVPMVLLAAVQAVWRQSPGLLVRSVLVNLPLAGLLTVMAVQLVQMSLGVTDSLCAAVSAGAGNDIAKALGAIATVMVNEMGAPSMPTFVVALGGLLVVAGALMLWLELVVREAAVYAAVLFLPLALASLVWPAVSHWCRRLVETLAAIVLSKFVIVAILSLAVGALGSGSGFAAVLAGGALLLLAAFTPFTLLRLVPVIESSAAAQLEGARHRVRQAWGSVPTGAASFALRQARQLGDVPGTPGIGPAVEAAAPGSGENLGSTADGDGGASGAGEGGAPPGPLWEGDPDSEREFLESLPERLRVKPDAYGDIFPGVPMPLWGGNLPPDRFTPGPADRKFWSQLDKENNENGADPLGGGTALGAWSGRGPGGSMPGASPMSFGGGIGADDMGPLLRWGPQGPPSGGAGASGDGGWGSDGADGDDGSPGGV